MGWGSSTRRGWWPKSSCPSSKVCLPWVSIRGIWDVPANFAGMSRTLGGVRKVCEKSSCAFFRSPIKRLFLNIATLFRLRLGLLGPQLGNSFWALFDTLGLKAQMTPVAGKSFCNSILGRHLCRTKLPKNV